MLTLLEADGCSQLQDEWGGTQDPLLIEIVSNLQCVPFGCRVAPFLVELAEQRAAKGCEVAIISNDVDIVVASRVANGAKWRHLGFMFVDAEFLLPGLAQIEPKLASFVTSCGLKQATSGNMRQAPSPKPAHLHVKKSIIKAQHGPCRSRAIVLSEAGLPGAATNEMVEELPHSSLHNGEHHAVGEHAVDASALDGSLASEAKCTIAHAPSEGAAQDPQETLPKSAQLPSAEAHALGAALADVDVPTNAHKQMVCSTYRYMYADTQVVDVDMGIRTSMMASSDAHDRSNMPVDMDQDEGGGSLQPTIEQDGPPALAATPPQGPQESTSGTSDLAPIAAAEADATERACAATPRSGEMAVQSATHKPCFTSSDVSETVSAHTSTPLMEEDITLEQDATRPCAMAVVVVEDDMPFKEADAPNAEAHAKQPDEVARCDERLDVDMVVAPTPGTGDILDVAFNSDAAALRVCAALPAAVHPQCAEVPLHGSGSQQQPRLCDPAVSTDAYPFDVDVLLGDWVRDGGRTHVVELNGGAGDSREPGAIEFWPAGGKSPKPIVRTAGTWALNGYILDEARSDKEVLRWGHVSSGDVRTWWRPGAKTPSDMSPSREESALPISTLVVASAPGAS